MIVGRYEGAWSNADNLSGRLFDIFLLHEQRKNCRYSCSHRPVLKRSVVAQEGFCRLYYTLKHGKVREWRVCVLTGTSHGTLPLSGRPNSLVGAGVKRCAAGAPNPGAP